MRFPLSLYLSMTRYLLRQRLLGHERYPLVLMLEPTHRCNLSCAGCGRIREYHDTLNREMSLGECLQAVDEAGAPVVTITGGEPLLYGSIQELVGETLQRGKHIYFCTNGQLLKESLHLFKPHDAFTWNIHFDGTAAIHDRILGRKGGFDNALEALKAAKKAGFRVSTNTTVYRETNLDDLERLFGQLTAAGADGLLVAPGFSYQDVSGDLFLDRREITRKFQTIVTWQDRFPFISNPIYLDFVAGNRALKCTPWGNPTRNPRGWKSPCYLITDTHYRTYRELMEKTDWNYYVEGKDPRCAQCMVHCGFEPTVVRQMNLEDLVTMIKWNMNG